MWSLYNESNEFLPPLTFSSGKTQEGVAKEVIAAREQGHKIIFMRGSPGSGKSALALNIAKEVGKTSVVVPVKFLQKQYEHDYVRKLKLYKQNGEQLKIAMITGRNNHPCLFNTEKKADYPFLPCIVEIRKENIDLLHQYVGQNPAADPDDFQELKDFTRTAVAGACPYWSPIVSEEFAQHTSIDCEKLGYDAIKKNRKYILQRKPGCGYYNQFHAYRDADVIIFNSKKYELENLMFRKPATKLEVIDEGDEFLDKLSNERKINLQHLASRIKRVWEHEKNIDLKAVLQEILELAIFLTKNNSGKEIALLSTNKAVELIDYFLRNSYLGEYEELEHYAETALVFADYKESSYVMYTLNARQETILHIVNVDLQKKLHEYLDRNETFVFMSGTLHSKKVLRDIFGITDYCMIEAEPKDFGTVKRVFTKKEKEFRYRNFQNGSVTRDEYLRALEECIALAPRPTLVHVNSFADLPSIEEQEKLQLTIMPAEKLQELQEGKTGELMQLFKQGKLDILYSTKCNRGVDFPGKMCNSIVYTKYPYPSMHDVFWQVLKLQKPDHYLEFYFDKAAREYKQRMYRGLRSKDDMIYLLSPDVKVLQP